MKIFDISKYIFDELGQPDDISCAAVNTWLRANIGVLNLKIGTSYSLTSVGEITPELGNNELAIFKALYAIYYMDKRLRASLGASSIETVLQIDSDGGSVKFLNRSEVSKTYLQAKKTAMEELNNLLDDYTLNEFSPIQTVGKDTESIYPYLEGNHR